MNIEKAVIKKIVHGGFGLSHLSSGKTLLVQRTLPGEIIKIAVTETKKNYSIGRLQKIILPHKKRAPAPCKYYDQCGGCNLQHCDIQTQLTIKKNILLDLLQRSREGNVQNAVNTVANPVPSPSDFGYRQRIRLLVDEDGRVGFRRFRSHRVCHVDHCLLAAPPINDSLERLVKQEGFQSLMKLATEIELQLNPGSAKIACLIHFRRKPRPSDVKAAKSLCSTILTIETIFFLGDDYQMMGPYGSQEKPPAKHLHISYPEVKDRVPPLEFFWEAGGFCQVNLEQNRQLIQIVLNFSKVGKNETVLDLFCGMGNFSIPLARQAKQVTGIEGQGGAIRSARLNSEHDGLDNTEFIKGSINDSCRKLREQGICFDCVIIDPPRQGIPSLASTLAELTKKRLVYISCDPATLCRDLDDLTETGFTIQEIQPIDMFPQTHHIETVVLLEKTG